MKRYRVETLTSASNTWEAVYYTDSLPVARRYTASLRDSQGIPMARVMDQRTDQAVYYVRPMPDQGELSFDFCGRWG